ncbi:MAG TPA: hypothetical protein EYQ47_08460 [Cycloclasticus sp.]|nr:hypothetical protein [Cycloclasticus sp.]
MKSLVTIDRYGRTVGRLFVGSLNINKQMVRAGHAWAYKRYMKVIKLIGRVNGSALVGQQAAS